jgi:predicted phosphate transport protein (TIGR00153 family)
LLRRLLPKKPRFFELFSRHAALAVRGAEMLEELLAKPEDAEAQATRIRAVEHEADEVCQRTIELLHSSFVTPIERGDIHDLASRLDDILDLIEETARCVWLYDVTSSRPEAIEMARHLVEATRGTKALVDALSRHPTPERTQELSRAVKQVEKQNDRLLRSATARLFHDEQDAKTLIKWKEIYAQLEAAIDRCEDVANLIEGVVLENA